MRTKRWVRFFCFLLLLLLTMQPLCIAAALAASEAEGQAFVEAAYAFVDASRNVPFETVIRATPGALETAKALNAITPKDAQAVEAAFSGKNAKVKFIPVVGAGLRYEITEDLFGKLMKKYGKEATTVSVAELTRILQDVAEKVDAAQGGITRVGGSNSHIVKIGADFQF